MKEPKYKIGDIVIINSRWLKNPTMLEIMYAKYYDNVDCWYYMLGHKSLGWRSYENGRYVKESEIIRKA